MTSELVLDHIQNLNKNVITLNATNGRTFLTVIA